MKVAIINSDIGYGSTGRIVYDLYEAVMADGEDALLAYGRENTIRNLAIRSVRIGDNFAHVYLHGLLTRLFDLQGFGSYYATKKFLRKLREYDPDLIHLHNIHGSYLNCKLLFDYIRETKKPVIWTLHDCWPFTGHCAHYTYARCQKWKTGCHHCIQKKVYPASLLLDGSRFNYERKKQLFTGIANLTITTVSEWLKNEVKQSFLMEYPVQVIPNSIDLEKFRPIENNFKKIYHLEDKKIILGVSSVWHNRKGLGLFQKLAEELDDSYQIVLVGVAKRQRKYLSKRILVLPRTNHTEKLAKIYTAADIFLNASVEETFGLVTLEALACGTPVVTNRYSANPELIDDSCGIVAPAVNSKSYYKAIKQLEERNIQKENCIRKAQQYVKNDQTYLKLYHEVIF
ncbi:MAG: glycosyl transferase [Herbinix sp.]|nr:glycosyl transferase [Herbinix sp.]